MESFMSYISPVFPQAGVEVGSCQQPPARAMGCCRVDVPAGDRVGEGKWALLARPELLPCDPDSRGLCGSASHLAGRERR